MLVHKIRQKSQKFLHKYIINLKTEVIYRLGIQLCGKCVVYWSTIIIYERRFINKLQNAVLSSRLNCSRLRSGCRNLIGKLFHVLGPATV